MPRAADAHGDADGAVAGWMQAGLPQSLIRGYQSHLAGAVDASQPSRRDVGSGIEIRHLRRVARFHARGIEGTERADAGMPGQQMVDDAGGIATAGGNDAHAGDHDLPVHRQDALASGWRSTRAALLPCSEPPRISA